MWDYNSFINVYTRTPINAKHFCIDHIFVKNNNLINQFQAGVIQTTITDQYSTLLLIPIIKKQISTGKCKIETVNYKKVENKLKTESWKDLYNNTDVHKCCNIFYNKLDNALSTKTNNKYKRIKE